MRVLSFFLAWCLLLPSQGVAFEKPHLRGVKGKDDRVLIQKYQYPWSAIGKLNAKGSFCTASLVAPKVILTAAHCLWNHRRKKWYAPHNVHFLPGYQRGEYIAHTVATKFHIAPTYNPRKKSTIQKAATDWALLELKDDISDQTGVIEMAPFGVKQFQMRQKDKTRFAQAGYSQDKAHILSVNESCPLKRYATKYNLIYHACDAVHGDSGSPILFESAGKTKIAAIHVATTATGVSEGIAVSVGPILQYLRKIRSE